MKLSGAWIGKEKHPPWSGCICDHYLYANIQKQGIVSSRNLELSTPLDGMNLGRNLGNVQLAAYRLAVLLERRQLVGVHIGAAKDDELLLAAVVLFDAPARPDPVLGRLGDQRLLELRVPRLQLLAPRGALRGQPRHHERFLWGKGLVELGAAAVSGGGGGLHVEEEEAAVLGGAGRGVANVDGAVVWDGVVGEKGGKLGHDSLVGGGVDPCEVGGGRLPGRGDGDAVAGGLGHVGVHAADRGLFGAFIGVMGADPFVLDLLALDDGLEQLDGIVAVAEGEEGEFGDRHGFSGFVYR